jgi:katanin p60 ATPase-containing subunit A1
MNDAHPILANIYEARDQGERGNYESALRSYSIARDLAEFERKSCRARGELTKWNALIKDIVAEEMQIRRLRTTVDEILKELSFDDAQHQAALERGPEPGLKPDFVTNVNARRRKSDPSRPEKAPPPRNPPRGRLKSPRGPPQAQRPSLTENPLMQQIIDNGILIREPDVTWDSIAGLEDVKKLLRQNLVILPMRPDIAHGLLSPWRSVLFYGPPGTGKTFLAKAVATECHRTFFNITSATITSKWLGESEKLIQYLFDLAEEMAPSTVFFDEIDSLASQRGTANEDETSRRMKAQLLTKFEGIDSSPEPDKIFVLAATNFPWDLDEALLRRFQKRVYIPLPDRIGRVALLRMHLEEITDERFDAEKWADRLDGYSCADIANLCRDAAQRVFHHQMELLDTQQWVNMPVHEAQVIVKDDDFAWAMTKRKSSVNRAQLRRYEEWRDTRGAE